MKILAGGVGGGRVLLFDSLPSTNRWAMANLADCRHGDVVCAARQTGGVGRFSREWLVPEDRGLALSVILKEMDICNIGQLGALAVSESLGSFGIDAELKWPNDVLVGGKKIAGILAERDSDSGTIVLGIGLNVNLTMADLEGGHLGQLATSMLLEKESSFEIEGVRMRLVASLDSEIAGAAKGSDCLAGRWGESDYLRGHMVTVSSSGSVICGEYLGVDARGRMLLRDATGSELAMWSGDVEKLCVSSP